MSEKFVRGCGIFLDLNTFDPKSYFKYYDHYEDYDPHKEYTTNVFTHDYGKGNRTYQYNLYTITDLNNKELVKEFVVTEEIISDEELNQLKPFCQCEYHTKSYFNPMKYFTCRCCHGCLDSPFYRPYVVQKTRAFLNKNKP